MTTKLNKARVEEIERYFYDYVMKQRSGPQFSMSDFDMIRELTDFAFSSLTARPEVGEIERLKEALRLVKAFVVGERSPNWHDDAMTYITRGKIADACDIALAHPHHPRDMHLTVEARRSPLATKEKP